MAGHCTVRMVSTARVHRVLTCHYFVKQTAQQSYLYVARITQHVG